MLDLTADCLGEFVYKFHYTRIFIGRCSFLYIGLYLLDQLFGVLVTILLGEYNRGFYYLSAYLVGYTGNGTLKY